MFARMSTTVCVAAFLTRTASAHVSMTRLECTSTIDHLFHHNECLSHLEAAQFRIDNECTFAANGVPAQGPWNSSTMIFVINLVVFIMQFIMLLQRLHKNRNINRIFQSCMMFTDSRAPCKPFIGKVSSLSKNKSVVEYPAAHQSTMMALSNYLTRKVLNSDLEALIQIFINERESFRVILIPDLDMMLLIYKFTSIHGRAVLMILVKVKGKRSAVLRNNKTKRNLILNSSIDNDSIENISADFIASADGWILKELNQGLDSHAIRFSDSMAHMSEERSYCASDPIKAFHQKLQESNETKSAYGIETDVPQLNDEFTHAWTIARVESGTLRCNIASEGNFVATETNLLFFEDVFPENKEDSQMQAEIDDFVVWVEVQHILGQHSSNLNSGFENSSTNDNRLLVDYSAQRYHNFEFDNWITNNPLFIESSAQRYHNFEFDNWISNNPLFIESSAQRYVNSGFDNWITNNPLFVESSAQRYLNFGFDHGISNNAPLVVESSEQGCILLPSSQRLEDSRNASEGIRIGDSRSRRAGEAVCALAHEHAPRRGAVFHSGPRTEFPQRVSVEGNSEDAYRDVELAVDPYAEVAGLALLDIAMTRSARLGLLFRGLRMKRLVGDLLKMLVVGVQMPVLGMRLSDYAIRDRFLTALQSRGTAPRWLVDQCILGLYQIRGRVRELVPPSLLFATTEAYWEHLFDEFEAGYRLADEEIRGRQEEGHWACTVM